MLKLTTDKHEASRGLSETAELLVCSMLAEHGFPCQQMLLTSDIGFRVD